MEHRSTRPPPFGPLEAIVDPDDRELAIRLVTDALDELCPIVQRLADLATEAPDALRDSQSRDWLVDVIRPVMERLEREHGDTGRVAFYQAVALIEWGISGGRVAVELD